jgi:CPA2 family monovalent cation:H+ antiporter-2
VHEIDLILTLTGALTAALILGYITQQLRLSPIVGYLLAGIAVGPHTPGFAADAAIAQQLAEVGVILLLFGVGLNFHIRELLAVRQVAVPGAIVACGVACMLGMAAAHLQGYDWAAGIVYGSAISVASTVVLIRVLSDNRDLHTRSGHIAVGWVVVEDLITVAALVVLPALLGGETAGLQGVALALAAAAGALWFLAAIGVGMAAAARAGGTCTGVAATAGPIAAPGGGPAASRAIKRCRARSSAASASGASPRALPSNCSPA